MCFSAEADLVAGAVVTAAGIDALRHVRAPREKALAGLTVVFGVHQFIEVAVGGLVTVFYIAATCGAALLSSDRVVVAFGAVNLVAVSVLAALLTSGVISLWCVWAAVTSVAIALHLRGLRRRPTPVLTG